LILWARINQWRFRGKERRTGLDATDMSALCGSFGLELSDIEAVRGHRSIAVTFVADDRVTLNTND
jgi:poly-beta-1,6-N-acetyl-D-glucosamine biosynthesis protein PgaD